MSKQIKLKLNIFPGRETNIIFQQPTIRKGLSGVIDILNVLVYLVTIFFFFCLFIFTNIRSSTNSSVDLVFLIYCYIIVIALLQFVRFIFAGDNFFPKIKYDFLVLMLSPFIIVALALTGNPGTNFFGDSYLWDMAGITIISLIILPYVLALNFSNKRGEGFLKTMFDISILIASLFYIVDKNSVAEHFDILVLLLVPVYAYRFIRETNLASKLMSLYIVVFGIISMLSNQYYRVLFVYDIFLIILAIKFFIMNKGNSMKKIGDSVKFVGSKSVKEFLSNNQKQLSIIVLAIFFVLNLFWLFREGHVQYLVTTTINAWKNYFNYGFSIKNLLIGSGVQISDDYLLAFLSSYGLLNLFLTGGVLGYIYISLMKRNTNSTIAMSALIYMVMFLVTSIFFGFGLSVIAVLWIMLGFALITSRDEDIDFSKVKILQMNLKNKKMLIFLHIVRILIVVVSFIVITLLLVQFSNLIGK